MYLSSQCYVNTVTIKWCNRIVLVNTATGKEVRKSDSHIMNSEWPSPAETLLQHQQPAFNEFMTFGTHCG